MVMLSFFQCSLLHQHLALMETKVWNGGVQKSQAIMENCQMLPRSQLENAITAQQ